MVHLPGPIYPRTRYVEETLELLLKKHPDASMAEIERLIPDCRNVSRKVLEEMVAGIKQRRGQPADRLGRDWRTQGFAVPSSLSDSI